MAGVGAVVAAQEERLEVEPTAERVAGVPERVAAAVDLAAAARVGSRAAEVARAAEVVVAVARGQGLALEPAAKREVRAGAGCPVELGERRAANQGVQEEKAAGQVVQEEKAAGQVARAEVPDQAAASEVMAPADHPEADPVEAETVARPAVRGRGAETLAAPRRRMGSRDAAACLACPGRAANRGWRRRYRDPAAPKAARPRAPHPPSIPAPRAALSRVPPVLAAAPGTPPARPGRPTGAERSDGSAPWRHDRGGEPRAR